MPLPTFRVYISYSQFLIFDATVKGVGLDWNDAHFNQGFARTDSTVSFRTIFQFGFAEVEIYYSTYERQKDEELVISVPFRSVSGRSCLFAPDEDEPNSYDLEPGDYILTSAQVPNHEEESLIVRLYFEKVSIAATKSLIVVNEGLLEPEYPLLETANIAE